MTLHLTGYCRAHHDEQDAGLRRLQYDLWVASTLISRLRAAADVSVNEFMHSVTFEWQNVEDALFIHDAFEGGAPR
jgi:hypothetical protein